MRIPHTSFLVFSAMFILSGCGYMFAPKYSDPIYTQRAPLISLRYEYQDIHIYAPVQLVNTLPEAYQVYIFDKDNEVDALFAATYMPEEKLEVYLPQNTLSTDKNGNIFVISPQGRDMPEIKKRFTGKRYGDITLPVTQIIKTPAIVEGIVFRRYDDRMLGGIQVVAKDSTGRAFYTKSRLDGDYRFELPNEYGYRNDLVVSAGVGSLFPVVTKDAQFGGNFNLELDFPLGPSKEFVEQGNLYIVKNNLTPIRTAFFNGSTTLFLLAKNDIVAVQRVAGNKLYGLVEIFWTDGNAEMISGWVRAQDVIYAANYFLSPQDDLELAKQ